jgi:uncharacterized membrane protein YgcG
MGLVVAAALASIAITALLTFALWRMNQPERETKRSDGGDGGMAYSGGSAKDESGGDGGSDGGGGGDGGGGK